MSKQVITSPSGERLVILPEADYESLIARAEHAEDIAAFDVHQRRVAAGEEESIPSAMMKRLIEGESPIRVWREHRGLSAAGLARQTGLSAPYISQIETGAREPGIKALKSIAQALGVDVDDLI